MRLPSRDSKGRSPTLMPLHGGTRLVQAHVWEPGVVSSGSKEPR